ncbi:MAG TPA: hypothetical protein VHV32_13715 [Candidatus Angelobacter sp.]|nr:hypothetical protein [Candidatus Angelobacter sp.]
MADLKSFNATPVNSSSTRRARMIGGAMTVAATAVLVLMVVLDFNGCSKAGNKNAQASPSSQNVSGPNTTSPIAATSQPVEQLEKKVEAVIEKKKAVKRASTATYKNSTYGISFRYPKTYTMLTPDADTKDSAWPDPVAMNFADPGGEILTTLVLPGTRASSYFKTSVNKGLTAEQCSKFASVPEPAEAAVDPAVDGTQASINPPIDADDDSIVPVKTNLLGVEFAKAESVTDQSEARYYHHFENGACYEFALGVEDAPGTTKPVDHLQVFDKLERIMTTVKIKSEPVPVVASSEPATPTVPASNPQQ